MVQRLCLKDFRKQVAYLRKGSLDEKEQTKDGSAVLARSTPQRCVGMSCGSPNAPKPNCRKTVFFAEDSPLDWEALPIPDGRIVVGLDGGYVRDWTERKSNFEVIVGRSMPEDGPSGYLGFVHGFDRKPQQRRGEQAVRQKAADAMDPARRASSLADPHADARRNAAIDLRALVPGLANDNTGRAIQGDAA
jgi:hypothetical protein